MKPKMYLSLYHHESGKECLFIFKYLFKAFLSWVTNVFRKSVQDSGWFKCLEALPYRLMLQNVRCRCLIWCMLAAEICNHKCSILHNKLGEMSSWGRANSPFLLGPNTHEAIPDSKAALKPAEAAVAPHDGCLYPGCSPWELLKC